MSENHFISICIILFVSDLPEPKMTLSHIDILKPLFFAFLTISDQHQIKTRYVPRNMGMPPACKVCMSYIFHAYTINKSNVSTNTFQIKTK